MGCQCAQSLILCLLEVQMVINIDNRIKSWQQLDKLRELPEFENTLLVGNPFYEILKDDAKYYALKKIPQLKNIDGSIV